MTSTERPAPVERPIAGAPDAPPLHSDEAFPPYRFVPGHTPHPYAQKGGYLFGERPEDPPYVPREQWRDNPAFLRGVDFFNRGWWWESHEVWEGLWHSTEGKDDGLHALLKALIQFAACAMNLERGPGHAAAAGRLLDTALAQLDAARATTDDGRLCGLDLTALADEARVRLVTPDDPARGIAGFYLRPGDA